MGLRPAEMLQKTIAAILNGRMRRFFRHARRRRRIIRAVVAVASAIAVDKRKKPGNDDTCASYRVASQVVLPPILSLSSSSAVELIASRRFEAARPTRLGAPPHCTSARARHCIWKLANRRYLTLRYLHARAHLRLRPAIVAFSWRWPRAKSNGAQIVGVCRCRHRCHVRSF